MADEPPLSARLRDVHNYIYANEGIKQFARITDEISKLILAKMSRDQRHESMRLDAPDSEVALSVRTAFAETLASHDISRLFDHQEQLRLSEQAIAYAMRKLGSKPLKGQDPEGEAFQAILGPILRGELGQFFTPDPVKSLLIEMTNPRVGEVVADPASGSAGLLLNAGLYQPDAHLVATEIDAALARLAQVNLSLSGYGTAKVLRLDALAPLSRLAESSDDLVTESSFDVIVTNPPFGSKGKIGDSTVLEDLSHVSAGKASMPPEILFVERIVQLLKPGGRAGIVVPSGMLSNPSLRHVRGFLRESGRIYATISLPVETFMKTGNSVNAAILFFEKTRSTSQYPTFRGISRSLGYDHRGREIGNSDIPQLLEAWREFARLYSEYYRWVA